MTVNTFDADYVEELVRRLQRMNPGARAAWGRMTPDEMVSHLVHTLRYSMGKCGRTTVRRSIFLRYVAGPLIINGIVRMPRGVSSPFLNPPNGVPSGGADLETLHAVLEEYLALVQIGELDPEPHPLFGNIGIDGWAKLHVVHFEHHLKQFGA